MNLVLILEVLDIGCSAYAFLEQHYSVDYTVFTVWSWFPQIMLPCIYFCVNFAERQDFPST